MDRVKVFLHPPGKFVYFAEPDTLPNNYKIDNLKLRYLIYHNYFPIIFSRDSDLTTTNVSLFVRWQIVKSSLNQ